LFTFLRVMGVFFHSLRGVGLSEPEAYGPEAEPLPPITSLQKSSITLVLLGMPCKQFDAPSSI